MSEAIGAIVHFLIRVSEDDCITDGRMDAPDGWKPYCVDAVEAQQLATAFAELAVELRQTKSCWRP